MILTFIFLSAFIIFYINKLMDTFCERTEIPDEKQPQVFRTTNILTTILLITTYFELLFL